MVEDWKNGAYRSSIGAEQSPLTPTHRDQSEIAFDRFELMRIEAAFFIEDTLIVQSVYPNPSRFMNDLSPFECYSDMRHSPFRILKESKIARFDLFDASYRFAMQDLNAGITGKKNPVDAENNLHKAFFPPHR